MDYAQRRGFAKPCCDKVKRVNITVPERVLAIIDEEARREGETRSGFLARAAFEYIGRHRKAS